MQEIQSASAQLGDGVLYVPSEAEERRLKINSIINKARKIDIALREERRQAEKKRRKAVEASRKKNRRKR